MDLINTIQCESCRENLRDFIESAGIRSDELIDTLVVYTMFCESRRNRVINLQYTNPNVHFPGVQC